ncbi:hypothetical protein AMK24_19290 [Streptomyces sp. CB02366]|nr:hypothetical protein AMK24_19290 [Streptomyces sp. CB02366]TVP34045.1 hypothetical protein A3L22_14760 [Streptomyces griseus subsp. griseus]
MAYPVITSPAGVQTVSSVLSGGDDLDRRVEERREILLPGLVPADRKRKVAGLPNPGVPGTG